MSMTVGIWSVAAGQQAVLVADLAQGAGLGSIKNESRLELGKSWSCINFLLTGTAYEGDFPDSFIVNGGSELVESEDELDCPPRWLEVDEVVQINDFLSRQSTNALLKNCNVSQMVSADVYSLSEDTFDDVREEISDLLPRLIEFVRNAALAGRALVLSGPS